MMDHKTPEEIKSAGHRYHYRRLVPVHTVHISDITANEANRVQVHVTATGRRVWLPRHIVDFGPHRVTVPDWLYRQMKPYFEPEKVRIPA